MASNWPSSSSSLESEEECLKHANRLIKLCGLSWLQVCSVQDMKSEFFVNLFEKICGMQVPDLIFPANTAEEEAHNVQAIIDTLSMDLLNISLSHIAGEDIIAGNLRAIGNLLQILEGCSLYFSNERKKTKEAPKNLDDPVAPEPSRIRESSKFSVASEPSRIGESSKFLVLSEHSRIGESSKFPVASEPSRIGESSKFLVLSEHSRIGESSKFPIRSSFSFESRDKRKDKYKSQEIVCSLCGIPQVDVTKEGFKSKVCPACIQKSYKTTEVDSKSTSDKECIPGPSHAFKDSVSNSVNGRRSSRRKISVTDFDDHLLTDEIESMEKWKDKYKSITHVCSLCGFDPLDVFENCLADVPKEVLENKVCPICCHERFNTPEMDSKSSHDKEFQVEAEKDEHHQTKSDEYTESSSSRMDSKQNEGLQRGIVRKIRKLKRKTPEESADLADEKRKYLQSLKSYKKKSFSPYGSKSIIRSRKQINRMHTPKRNHLRTHSSSSRKGDENQSPEEKTLIKEIMDEFPGVRLSPSTLRQMTNKYEKHLLTMRRKLKDCLARKSQTQVQEEEARKKQKILSNILKKEIHHSQYMNEIDNQKALERQVRANQRNARMESARLQHYYKEFYEGMRRKQQKKNYKEDRLLKTLLDDALKMQTDQVNAMSKELKEREEEDGRNHQIYLDALENFFENQFSMLAESLAAEKHDAEMRAKAQKQVLEKLKRDYRSELENEVRNMQENILRHNEDMHFRELDAERVRDKLQKRFRVNYQ